MIEKGMDLCYNLEVFKSGLYGGIHMKKIITAIFAIIICLFTMTGCMEKSLPDLPKDAIEFDMGTFHDSEHDDALFGSIEYSGRVYIPYGTINNRYNQSYIDSCIGYIIQNEHSSSVIDPDNTNRRIYTLSGDSEQNFLMDFDDTIKLMNQPTFFRALDTKGVEIDIPSCIDSLGYEFWEE